jgi:hypothetical protein
LSGDEEVAIVAERKNPVGKAEEGGRVGEASKLNTVDTAVKREDLGAAVQRTGRFERSPTTASGV